MSKLINQPKTRKNAALATASTSTFDVASPATIKSTQTAPAGLPYEIVHSLRLKRSLRKETDVKFCVHFPAADFQQLSVTGIQLGVTVDEVILGLVARELTDMEINGNTNLSKYIPVLNL